MPLHDGRVPAWIVALPGGRYRALSALDPRTGCALSWGRAEEFDGSYFRSEIEPGSFRDGCHGSTYDVTGRRVFGPTPWDMDVYASRVEESRGRLVVDLDELERQRGKPRSPPRPIDRPPDATPEPAAPPPAR